MNISKMDHIHRIYYVNDLLLDSVRSIMPPCQPKLHLQMTNLSHHCC